MFSICLLKVILRQSSNEILSITKINMGNIFLEKSHTKCGRITSSRPFSKKQKLSMSLDQ